MRVTEATEAVIADLEPDLAAFVRANVERVREPSEDDLQRLATLLGLERSVPRERKGA